MESRLERILVAAVATVVPTLAVFPGLSAVFQLSLGDQAGAAQAVAAILAILASAAAATAARAALGDQCPGWLAPVLALAAGGALALAGAFASALAVAGCAAAQPFAAAWLERRLPGELDGVRTRRPWLAALWCLTALVATVQTARLAPHMADREVSWFLTNDHPFWGGHQCMPAYVYAAELHERGEENVYDPAHYPGLNPQAEPHTRLQHFDGHIEDPFQYPPQFLVLPLLGLQLTDDYGVLRAMWFSLNALGILAAVVALARFAGGRRGRVALLLLPLLWCSVPLLQTLQYGQFHFAAYVLAIFGMLSFERRQHVLGGGLLGAAVVTKLFPGVLLVPLALQRRWRALAMTAAWGAGYTAVALAVLGPDPFVQFFEFHVPRLIGGEATAFGEAWPELADIVLGINLSVALLAPKLAWFGVPGAAVLGKAAALAVLAVIGWLAWRTARDGLAPGAKAVAWLAVLDLAVLHGPAGFADYVPAQTLWLLALVAADLRGVRLVLTAAAAAVLWSTVGLTPMPGMPPAAVMVAMGAVATVLLVGLNARAGLRATSVGAGRPAVGVVTPSPVG